MLEEPGDLESPYGDDADRLRDYAEKKYGEDGSQIRKMDPDFEGDAC